MDIEKFRHYSVNNLIFMTEHARERFRKRGINIKDIKAALHNGEIIETYPNDFPFPSCLILGKDSKNKAIHICISDEGSSSRIITAYYPSLEKWADNFKVRKE